MVYACFLPPRSVSDSFDDVVFVPVLLSIIKYELPYVVLLTTNETTLSKRYIPWPLNHTGEHGSSDWCWLTLQNGMLADQ